MTSTEKNCFSENDAEVNKHHSRSNHTKSSCSCNKLIISSINCWITTVIVSLLIFPSQVICDNGIFFGLPQTVSARMHHIDPKLMNISKKDQDFFWQRADLKSEVGDTTYEYETFDYSVPYNTPDEQAVIYDAPPETPLKKSVTPSQAQAIPPEETSSGCPNGRVCPKSKNMDTDESKLLEIEKLKARILKGLNLDAPPNITAPKLAFDSPPLRSILRSHGFKVDRTDPTRVEEQYYEYNEDDEMISKEEVVMSIAKKVKFPDFPLLPDGIRFSFTESEMDQSAKEATLWIYIKPNPTTDTRMTLHISRYERDDEGLVRLALFDTKILQITSNTTRGSWRRFKFHHTVNSWLLAADLNLGIRVSSPNHTQLIDMGDDDPTKKPMVEVKLVSRTSKRKRRSLTCNEETNESRCCKYNFVMDFEAIKWTFVIAPKTFNIYYCAGNCPYIMLKTGFKRMMSQYSHTSIASQKRRAGAQGCCSPTRLKSLSMLYFDNEQNVIYSTLPDMIVEECGCL